jgi:hypothetical protein
MLKNHGGAVGVNLLQKRMVPILPFAKSVNHFVQKFLNFYEEEYDAYQ